MKTPNVSHIRYSHDIQSNPGCYLSFREIFEAINYRDDFNEPQLFYLSRLVGRKLKAFDPRLNVDDLETKPYRSTNGLDL